MERSAIREDECLCLHPRIALRSIRATIFPRHCERSEAIHRAAYDTLDCFVAYAPRNDGDSANQFARISALIMSAAFSPIMMVGALVLPPIKVGITDASTMRRPSSP